MSNTLTYSELLRLRLSLIIKREKLTFVDTPEEYNTKLYKIFGRFYPTEDIAKQLYILEEKVINDMFEEQDIITYPDDYDISENG